MVGACQQNSGIFLVRGGGLDGRSAGAGSGLGRNEAKGLLLRKTRWGR